MPTQRTGETRTEFLSRRRKYDREYEHAKRPRTPAGKRIRSREQMDRDNTRRREKRAQEKLQRIGGAPSNPYEDLIRHPSWVKSIRGKTPTPEVARWFRRGFLKIGPANEGDIFARRAFLAWMLAYKSKVPRTTTADIKRRVGNQSRQTIEQGAGFDWVLWREDYETTKAAIG
jgi:hypothetical protein